MNVEKGEHYTNACRCGAVIDARVPDEDAVELLETAWKQVHSGKGHAPCSVETARRILAEKDAIDDDAGGT